MFALFLPIQVVRISTAASSRSYTIEKATSEVRFLCGQEAHVIGGSAIVFGTRSSDLILLDRQWAGYNFFGQRLIPVFRPTHMVVPRERSEAEFAVDARDGAWGMGSLRSWHTSYHSPLLRRG